MNAEDLAVIVRYYRDVRWYWKMASGRVFGDKPCLYTWKLLETFSKAEMVGLYGKC